MSKNLLLFFLTVSFFSSFSQRNVVSEHVDVLWGEIMIKPKLNSFEQVIGSDSSGFYSIQKSKSNRVIVKYNNKLERLVEKELKFDSVYDDPEMFFYDVKEKTVNLFFKTQNRKTDYYYFNYLVLDKNSLVPLNRGFYLIDSIEISNNKSYDLVNYGIQFSSDSSVFVLYNYILENDSLSLGLIWMKEGDYGIIKNERIDLPNIPHKSTLMQLEIDSLNNCYLLINEKISKNEKDEFNNLKDLNKLYKIEKGMVNVIELNAYDKFFNELSIVDVQDSIVALAGFYSNISGSSIAGTFCFKADFSAQQIREISYNKFDLDFITYSLSDRQERKIEKKVDNGKQVEFYNYKLTDVVSYNNGEVILIGEQQYTETRSFYNPSCKCYQNVPVYNKNHIIVCHLNEEGEMLWQSKIPKHQQKESNSLGLGYAVTRKNDKLYFVFNDNVKNNLANISREMGDYYTYSGNKAMVNLAVLNLERNGFLEYETLWDYHEDISHITPENDYDSKGFESMLFLANGKRSKYRYVQIKTK